MATTPIGYYGTFYYGEWYYGEPLDLTGVGHPMRANEVPVTSDRAVLTFAEGGPLEAAEAPLAADDADLS